MSEQIKAGVPKKLIYLIPSNTDYINDLIENYAYLETPYRKFARYHMITYDKKYIITTITKESMAKIQKLKKISGLTISYIINDMILRDLNINHHKEIKSIYNESMRNLSLINKRIEIFMDKSELEQYKKFKKRIGFTTIGLSRFLFANSLYILKHNYDEFMDWYIKRSSGSFTNRMSKSGITVHCNPIDKKKIDAYMVNHGVMRAAIFRYTLMKMIDGKDVVHDISKAYRL